MPSQLRHITLSNGIQLPRIGLGTFKSKGTDVQRAVVAAVQLGITHIDTASIYKNEEDISNALREAGISQSSVFITSKVSPYEQGTDKAMAACEAILSRLNTTHVDLMLIHWPGVARKDASAPINAERRLETWRVLEKLYTAGKCRAIGVSNFQESHIRELLQHAHVPPMVNQIEVHPRYPATALREYCKQAGIAVVAYASLGGGELLQNAVVMDVAATLHKTPAQVLLRWGLDKGCAVIPKSIRTERISQSSEDSLLTWELGAEDMARLDALEDGHKYCWDPSGIV